MNMRKLLYAIALPLFLLLSFMSSAQDKLVNGRVSDSSGRGVPGISVSVKGQTLRGTTTSDNGGFSLSVPSSATTLVFSSVGFASQEVSITGTNSVNITMQSTAGNLNEVVVIGYGTARKRDLTGSVTTVTAKDFNRGIITTPEQLIAGKVAGVSITPNDGAPGSGSSIRIRGGSSLNASNSPLIVIDGMPLSNSGIAGAPNPLALINPNDIASFTVLKDASAAAIYGSRGSNGVVLITTKKGKAGKTSFNAGYYTGVTNVTREVEYINSTEWLALYEEAFRNSNGYPLPPDFNLGKGLTPSEVVQGGY
ncbi:MAG: TonB-dependent receptor plug domain-containing protein, partial [Chitinophagaceae bacterium]|nr:TonB-dependent receptor plug domain-containing protein [Chitinophagaceae bacterium]